MGLLDEAIREHLDLKRRRGADPTEIERLEREALGPVRRVAQEPPAAGAVADHELGTSAQTGLEDELPGEPEYAPGDEFEHEEEFAPEPGYEYEPEDEDEYGAEEPAPHAGSEPAQADEPEAHEAAPPAEPAPPSDDRSDLGHVQPPAHEGLGVETAEYDVEAAHAKEDEEKSDDMLEETPEFLQDAPDHDRLWFEQRPPRDFDFDG
jgi:hypothetical protein